MTKQEIFDKVWQYFIVEKHERSAVDQHCFYRHPSGDGRRCAAGLFIKDEEYHKKLETFGVDCPDVARALTKSGFPAGQQAREFLREIQRVHDRSSGNVVDERELRRCALVNNLEVPS